MARITIRIPDWLMEKTGIIHAHNMSALIIEMIINSNKLINKDKVIYSLNQEITRLNNKFYLESTDANQDFRRTYIFFFPVIVDCAAMSNPAQARSKAHYTVEVTYNDTDKIESRVASPTALKAGNKVNKRWLANYFLGRDPKRGVAVNIPAPVGGGTSITKDDLKFIRKWIRDELGDNTFTVKDAV